MKIVGQIKYVHLSAITSLTPNEASAIYKTINKVQDTKVELNDPDVISIQKSVNEYKITLAFVNDFDNANEPILIKSISCVVIGNVIEINSVTKYVNNPLIYHGKHLFVNPNYNGFDYNAAKLRYENYKQLNPDITKMGRLNWWENWCKQNHIEI